MKLLRYSSLVLLFTLLSIVLIPAADAQSAGSTTANLSGTVRDASLAVVEGARITAKKVDTNFIREVNSVADGSFLFAQLSPGDYKIVVEAKGFNKESLSCNLALGTTTVITITLKVGATDAVVEVNADNSYEATTESSVNVTRVGIDVLPINRRNFLDFTLTSSRVVTDRLPIQGVSATSGLSFNGQSARSNNITIDGLDNNDIASGSVRSTFSQEAVQEFQIIPDGISAEFGRALGGIVNIVTRSGSNKLHGSLFLLNRNDQISARDAFAAVKPPFSQYQFGASASGPIKRDKLFLFTSFERLSVQQSNIVTISDEVVRAVKNRGLIANNGAIPFAVAKTMFLVRADAKWTANDTISLRYNFGGSYDGELEPFGDIVAETSGAIERLRDHSLAINNTYVAPQLRLINETRFLYGHRSQNVATITDGPNLDISQPNGSNIFGTNVFTPQRREERIYQIVNNVSLDRGINQIKFGVDYNYIGAPEGQSTFSFTNSGIAFFQPINFSALLGLPGLPNFSSLEALDPGLRSAQQRLFLNFLAGVLPMNVPGFPKNLPLADLSLPFVFAQGFGSLRVSTPATLFSAFAQDDIKLRSNFLIKLGLRYDLNRLRFMPKNNGNLSPRLALSYRSLRIPKLNMRASYALFFGVPVFGPATLISKSQRGDFKIPVLVFPQSILPFAMPGNRFPESDQLPPNLNFAPQLALSFQYDRNLRNSYSQQVSYGFDYLFNNDTLLSVGYNFVRGVKLFAARRVNPIVRPIPGDVLQSSLTGRVDPTRGSVTEFESAFDSYYHGGTIFLGRRLTNRIGFFATYTFSKTIDNVLDLRTDTADSPQDTLQPGNEKALSVQDTRNRFVLSGNWKLDYTKNLLLRDFQLSTIITLESGRPYNLLVGQDLNLNGDQGDRPNGMGRNSGITPGFSNVDLRLTRTIKFKDTYQMQLFVESFNSFNRFNLRNFARVFMPDAQGNFNLPQKQDGRFIVPRDKYLAAFAPRQFQFGFKLSF